MKKNEINVRVNTKEVNAASKGIVKANNAAKKEIKQDRKTLRATVAYLATAETETAAMFRAFLNLKKNANKSERNNVCAWIQARYLYVTNKYVVTSSGDEVEVENFGTIPCNKNGRIYNDMIDAITEIKNVYEKSIAQRTEIARQMWNTRNLLIAKREYHDRIQNVLNCINRAPAKIHKQIRLTDTIIRK